MYDEVFNSESIAISGFDTRRSIRTLAPATVLIRHRIQSLAAMQHIQTHRSLPDKPPSPTYSSRRQMLILATLCMAVLIAQIDTSVVNLAVRPIGLYFHAGVAQLQWAVDSYNLVYAVLLLTGGLLADLHGRRRIFMTGTATFTLASLLCGFAPNIDVLIVGRALAGVGAALMTPASLAILRVVWPDTAERGQALGIWAACNGLAFVIAPTLGGQLIEWFGWRSIFFLVVPIGLATCAMTVPTVPESSDPHERHFDLTGQILGTLTLGGLALAVIEAAGNRTVALSALATTLLAAILFISVEARKGSTALVPLDMFRLPAFRGAIIATAGMTFGMYGLLFLLPLTWQTLGTFGSRGAGLALMPMALAFILVSPFSGQFVDKAGARIVSSSGVALIGCGLWVLGMTANRPSIALGEVGLVLTGVGMGFATGPLLGAAIGAVSSVRSGTASALINVARITGATLGVAILGAVYASSSDPAKGLRSSMALGGTIQIVCALIAWISARPHEGATTYGRKTKPAATRAAATKRYPRIM